MQTFMDDLKRRMQGALDIFKKELGGLRTGRASVNLLDPVMVPVYGSHMPLSQIATVSVPEARMLSIHVWDAGNAAAVDKAIRESGLGLNPISEGQTIRVPLPDLTEDRRKELGKVAAKYAEAARVSVRNVRRDGVDALRAMEKEGNFSEDDLHRNMTLVQELTDKHIKEIDTMLADKEKEIMHI